MTSPPNRSRNPYAQPIKRSSLADEDPIFVEKPFFLTARFESVTKRDATPGGTKEQSSLVAGKRKSVYTGRAPDGHRPGPGKYDAASRPLASRGMWSHVDVAASGTSHSSEDEAGRWREIARLAKRHHNAEGRVERQAVEPPARRPLIDARHKGAKEEERSRKWRQRRQVEAKAHTRRTTSATKSKRGVRSQQQQVITERRLLARPRAAIFARAQSSIAVRNHRPQPAIDPTLDSDIVSMTKRASDTAQRSQAAGQKYSPLSHQNLRSLEQHNQPGEHADHLPQKEAWLMQWIQAGFSQTEGHSDKTTTPMQNAQVPLQEAANGHKQENGDQSRSFHARAGGAHVPTKLQMQNISNQLVQLAARLVNHTKTSVIDTLRSRFDAREKKKAIAHSVTDSHHAALRRPVEGKADEFASPELLDSHERQRRKHALPSLLDELDFSPDEQGAKDLF